MAITVDQLESTQILEDSDKIMLTHTDGQTETITAANFMKNGAKAISLTRAEYDALTEKKSDTFYIITDEAVTGVPVDQTFKPESLNAQSGVAVNGALANYASKSELVKYLDIVKSTDANGYADCTGIPDNCVIVNVISLTQGYGAGNLFYNSYNIPYVTTSVANNYIKLRIFYCKQQ